MIRWLVSLLCACQGHPDALPRKRNGVMKLVCLCGWESPGVEVRQEADARIPRELQVSEMREQAHLHEIPRADLCLHRAHGSYMRAMWLRLVRAPARFQRRRAVVMRGRRKVA